MNNDLFYEYRYMDDNVKRNREKALKNFLKNNDKEDLLFYDLNMYDKRKTLSSKILSVVNKSQIDPSITLNKYQIEILNILNNNNLFLSAPTSFGKTFIMLEFIKRNIASLNNIIFIIPTLALMNELLKKIYNSFHDKYNICINGSEQIDKKNIFVFVPERSDKDFLEKIKELDIDLLIFDEIYKLQPKNKKEIKNDDRIIYMNKVYLDLLKVSKKIALLGPYINNVTFQRTKLDIVKYYTNYIPVYNEINVLDDEDWTKYIKLEKQLIYFSSPSSIYKNIDKILNNVQENSIYSEMYKDEINYLQKNISTEWYVISLLKRGIGIHHGKTPMFLRKFYENEYNSGNIKILLCTNTLMEGINTPTNSLIVVDDPGSPFQLNNLIGRVGRLNIKNPIIGEIIISNQSIIDNTNNMDNWYDLKILAENNEVSSEDEIIYLNKKYSDENKKGKMDDKVKLLLENNISIEDIVYQNLKLNLCYRYMNEKIYNCFENVNDLHSFVVAGTKLINPPSYIFNLENYENINFTKDRKYLPYKYYICDILNHKPYINLVNNFNKNYNLTNNIKNINIFIDSLYQLNNFIKFKFIKIVQYIETCKKDSLEKNENLQKYIGLLSNYNNFDTINKILDDLGINEEDFLKIIEILNISNSISTSTVIKLIRQKKEIILKENISPFTKNNINNI